MGRPTKYNQNTLILKIPKARVNAFKFWFCVRVCYTWNNSPDYYRRIAPNINNVGKIDQTFKWELHEFIMTNFDEKFQNCNLCSWRL